MDPSALDRWSGNGLLSRIPLVRRLVPLVAEAAGFIAHLAIRTRGTIGGSLAHADPAAELPATLATLEARLVLRNSDGAERLLAPHEFSRSFHNGDRTWRVAYCSRGLPARPSSGLGVS